MLRVAFLFANVAAAALAKETVFRDARYQIVFVALASIGISKAKP